jgi:hypothetical protein
MEKSPNLEKPKKSNFRIIGGVLIIGAVLGGAEYFSHDHQTNQTNQTNQETPAKVIKLIDNPPKNSLEDYSVPGGLRFDQNGVEEYEKSWLAQTPNGTSVNISIFYVSQRKDHKTILEPNQVNMKLSANSNTNNFEVAYGLVEVNGKWTYNYAQYLSSNYPNQINVDGSQIQTSSLNSTNSRLNTTLNNKKQAQLIDKEIINGMASTMQNIYNLRNDTLKPISLTQK